MIQSNFCPQCGCSDLCSTTGSMDNNHSCVGCGFRWHDRNALLSSVKEITFTYEQLQRISEFINKLN